MATMGTLNAAASTPVGTMADATHYEEYGGSTINNASWAKFFLLCFITMIVLGSITAWQKVRNSGGKENSQEVGGKHRRYQGVRRWARTGNNRPTPLARVQWTKRNACTNFTKNTIIHRRTEQAWNGDHPTSGVGPDNDNITFDRPRGDRPLLARNSRR